MKNLVLLAKSIEGFTPREKLSCLSSLMRTEFTIYASQKEVLKSIIKNLVLDINKTNNASLKYKLERLLTQAKYNIDTFLDEGENLKHNNYLVSHYLIVCFFEEKISFNYQFKTKKRHDREYSHLLKDLIYTTCVFHSLKKEHFFYYDLTPHALIDYLLFLKKEGIDLNQIGSAYYVPSQAFTMEDMKAHKEDGTYMRFTTQKPIVENLWSWLGWLFPMFENKGEEFYQAIIEHETLFNANLYNDGFWPNYKMGYCHKNIELLNDDNASSIIELIKKQNLAFLLFKGLDKDGYGARYYQQFEQQQSFFSRCLARKKLSTVQYIIDNHLDDILKTDKNQCEPLAALLTNQKKLYGSTYIQQVKTLIQAGCQITNFSLFCFLYFFGFSQNIELVGLLNKEGKLSSFRDQRGNSALMYGLSFNFNFQVKHSLATHLLEQNFSMQSNSAGHEPIHAIARKKRLWRSSETVNLVNLMLEKGANINSKTKQGNNLFLLSCKTKAHPYFLNYLIEKGSDIFNKNKFGISGYDCYLNYYKSLSDEDITNQEEWEELHIKIEKMYLEHIAKESGQDNDIKKVKKI